jgi:hypothetical protein
MNPFESKLSCLLRTAAFLQIGIAILNLFLVRLLGWRADLQRVPLLLKEVFQVHAWFISVTLLIFGTITWRFAGVLAANSDPIGRWLAAGVGGFWALRAVLQVVYYSSSHWRRNPHRTMAHILLLAIYGGFATTYFAAAFARPPEGGL